MNRILVSLSLCLLSANSMTVFGSTVISKSNGVVSPSFRGDASTTWVGWDTFDAFLPGGLTPAAPGTPGVVIMDATPDVGTDGGFWETTNGEDHQSGSGNYYSSNGSVAELITFDTPAGTSDFTTVVVQGNTLFGGFGAPITFGDIDGVSPVATVFGTNALGQGQFHVKYELPGEITTNSFSLTSGPFSFNSIGIFTVDTLYSTSGFAVDSAVAVPEPSSVALIGALGLGVIARRRKR